MKPAQIYYKLKWISIQMLVTIFTPWLAAFSFVHRYFLGGQRKRIESADEYGHLINVFVKSVQDECGHKVPVESRIIQLPNKISLHFIAAGPTDGPVVLLLHGFPDCFYVWAHQIPSLARAGFRVIAPDLRGYGLSSKPDGIENYVLKLLAGDVFLLLKALGCDRARAVVGHDWGGAVAYQFAHLYPDAFEKLAILDSPHGAGFVPAIKKRPFQILCSWYTLWFQLPWIPELLLPMAPSFADKAGQTKFDEAMFRASMAQSGLGGRINYYRAGFIKLHQLFRLAKQVPSLHPDARPSREPSKVIEQPLLVLWGENDPYLDEMMATVMLSDPELHRLVPKMTFKSLPNVGHWISVESAGVVNQELLDFL